MRGRDLRRVLNLSALDPAEADSEQPVLRQLRRRTLDRPEPALAATERMWQRRPHRRRVDVTRRDHGRARRCRAAEPDPRAMAKDRPRAFTLRAVPDVHRLRRPVDDPDARPPRRLRDPNLAY